MDDGNLDIRNDVERRILRACCTIRALPDRDRRFFKIQSCWPEFVRDVEEAYGYDVARVRRFCPSPADISDCLTALAWARVLHKREWKIIWWRSFGISFRHIGIKIGRSDDTARRRYKDAIIKVWGEAMRLERAASARNPFAWSPGPTTPCKFAANMSNDARTMTK